MTYICMDRLLQKKASVKEENCYSSRTWQRIFQIKFIHIYNQPISRVSLPTEYSIFLSLRISNWHAWLIFCLLLCPLCSVQIMGSKLILSQTPTQAKKQEIPETVPTGKVSWPSGGATMDREAINGGRYAAVTLTLWANYILFEYECQKNWDNNLMWGECLCSLKVTICKMVSNVIVMSV